MGGPGSGRRWHYGEKATTDDYKSIDVRKWARDDFLTPGYRFTCAWTMNGEKAGSIQVESQVGRVKLFYRSRDYGGEWRPHEYPVDLDWTPCHLGGHRVWFRCPASGCGRRVAKLYGGKIFACRYCHDLAYRSQREGAHDRSARCADCIREKLGWPEGILNGSGWGKPKGMHWTTYNRLCAEHDALVEHSLASFVGRYGDFL